MSEQNEGLRVQLAQMDIDRVRRLVQEPSEEGLEEEAIKIATRLGGGEITREHLSLFLRASIKLDEQVEVQGVWVNRKKKMAKTLERLDKGKKLRRGKEDRGWMVPQFIALLNHTGRLDDEKLSKININSPEAGVVRKLFGV